VVRYSFFSLIKYNLSKTFVNLDISLHFTWRISSNSGYKISLQESKTVSQHVQKYFVSQMKLANIVFWAVFNLYTWIDISQPGCFINEQYLTNNSLLYKQVILTNQCFWLSHRWKTWLFLQQYFQVCPRSGNMAGKQCLMVLCAVNVFLRVDKMSRSGSDIDDKSYKNCVILAIRVTTCDTLKNKFSRAFPKLPFGCWSGNPVRIKTCRNVSPFLRVLPLVEQGESEFWADRPG
jgi:hypothetical protein